MAASVEASWSSFPSGLTPVAPRTGPFPLGGFLEAAWKYQHDPVAEDLVLAVADEGALALAVSNRGMRFVGPEHVTDYHTPLGVGAASALADAMSRYRGSAYRFDSLPEEAVDVVTAALDTIGDVYTVTEHEGAAVLDLPTSFDDWLMGIGKKERHEVRRKRRRFEAEYGEAVLSVEGIEALPWFADMHRDQPGDKGTFMTEEMEAFFGQLIDGAGAAIHVLSCGDRPLASAFGFETDDGYYYYNSAFDPAAASASPGIVLLALLIEHQIERGASVFDFLKGDEPYKYRHGAHRRPLFAIEDGTP